MNKKRTARIGAITRKDLVQNEIKQFLIKNKNIVYGARSINAQTGILLRDTVDWDAYSDNPKKSADKLQRKLDKKFGGDYFFSKPAMHKGTFKVKGKGDDLIPNTKDDEEIADFSKPEKKIDFVIISGLRYRKLKDEIKAKKKSIADPKFKFRHEKDQRDIDRIKDNMKIKEILK
jgi:hypothetical protein